MYGSVHLKNPCPRIVNSTGILTNFIKKKLFRSAFGITPLKQAVKAKDNLFYKHPPKKRGLCPRRGVGGCLRAHASSLSMVGRSMIEMLGVLAIIGVLSAGGIMGYSVAMENYKVNKTLDMIAKATSAVPQYFVKRKGGTGYAATEISTTALCKLNMLPSEICNATIVGVSSNYRKGYFGEALIIYVQQSGSGFAGAQEAIVKNDNSGKLIYIYGPLTRIVFGWDTPPKLGKSVCVKLLTSPIWQNLGKISHTISENNPVGRSHQLPLSVGTAESLCTARVDDNIRIYVYPEAKLVVK